MVQRAMAQLNILLSTVRKKVLPRVAIALISRSAQYVSVQVDVQMVDADGFRPNVGIVLTNRLTQVMWARRVGGHDAWQFPQGGINDGESPEAAMYRELHEEVGLTQGDVKILARTSGWLRYRLPRRLRRHNSTPGFVGQKQKWFLLEVLAETPPVKLDCGPKAEFDDWAWVSYWYPLTQVVDFKRDVYRRALTELAPYQIGH